MDLKIIYVVTAYRITKSQHSYVVGVYESLEAAEQAESIEIANRGGKYNVRNTPYVLNRLPEDLTNTEHD
jgi:hypothetical protein